MQICEFKPDNHSILTLAARMPTISLLDLYFINYPKDRWRNKCLVYGLFVFEAAQTALLTRDSFAILGSGWGDLSRLDYLGEMWLSGPFMNGISKDLRPTFDHTCSHDHVVICSKRDGAERFRLAHTPPGEIKTAFGIHSCGQRHLPYFVTNLSYSL